MRSPFDSFGRRTKPIAEDGGQEFHGSRDCNTHNIFFNACVPLMHAEN